MKSRKMQSKKSGQQKISNRTKIDIAVFAFVLAFAIGISSVGNLLFSGSDVVGAAARPSVYLYKIEPQRDFAYQNEKIVLLAGSYNTRYLFIRYNTSACTLVDAGSNTRNSTGIVLQSNYSCFKAGDFAFEAVARGRGIATDMEIIRIR